MFSENEELPEILNFSLLPIPPKSTRADYQMTGLTVHIYETIDDLPNVLRWIENHSYHLYNQLFRLVALTEMDINLASTYQTLLKIDNLIFLSPVPLLVSFSKDQRVETKYVLLSKFDVLSERLSKEKEHLETIQKIKKSKSYQHNSL